MRKKGETEVLDNDDDDANECSFKDCVDEFSFQRVDSLPPNTDSAADVSVDNVDNIVGRKRLVCKVAPGLAHKVDIYEKNKKPNNGCDDEDVDDFLV